MKRFCATSEFVGKLTYIKVSVANTTVIPSRILANMLKGIHPTVSRGKLDFVSVTQNLKQKFNQTGN